MVIDSLEIKVKRDVESLESDVHVYGPNGLVAQAPREKDSDEAPQEWTVRSLVLDCLLALPLSLSGRSRFLRQRWRWIGSVTGLDK